jgi:ABC-type sugar transport system ATPase subunit
MNVFPPEGDDLLGVRPEHLRFGPDGIPATVRVVESLGHEQHVRCELAGGEAAVVRLPAHEPAPSEGTAVHLQSEPQHRHHFDATTGVRR